MSTKNVGIHSPWVAYVEKLKALFRHDEDIDIQYDEEEQKVRILVWSQDKARALEVFLPEEVTFGNVSLIIEIIPSNDEQSFSEMANILFRDNPVYSHTRVVCPPGTGVPYTYVMFRNGAVQYWGDNLGDPHGNITTLAQDLAKDLFKDIPGLFYSTEKDSWETF